MSGPGRAAGAAPDDAPAGVGPAARFAPVHAELARIMAAMPPAPGGRVRAADRWARLALALAGVVVLAAALLVALGQAPRRVPPPHRPAPASAAAPAPVAVADADGMLGTRFAPPPPERPATPPAAHHRPIGRPAAPPANPAKAAPGRRGRDDRAPGPEPVLPASTAPAPPFHPRAALRPAPCPDGYRAWCLRDATQAADQELRQAYGDAVRAGVAPRDLRRVKHEWVRYRRQANRRPDELIRGYRLLAARVRALPPAVAAHGTGRHG